MYITVISFSYFTVNISVNDIHKIEKLEGRMSVSQLLRGERTPNKRKMEGESLNKIYKFKY